MSQKQTVQRYFNCCGVISLARGLATADNSIAGNYHNDNEFDSLGGGRILTQDCRYNNLLPSLNLAILRDDVVWPLLYGNKNPLGTSIAYLVYYYTFHPGRKSTSIVNTVCIWKSMITILALTNVLVIYHPFWSCYDIVFLQTATFKRALRDLPTHLKWDMYRVG